MQVRRRLEMNGNHRRSGRRECFDVPFRLDHHQVNVKRHASYPSQRLHNWHAYRDIGDEPPVHHVDMKKVGAPCLDRACGFTQGAEVARQDRWRNTDVGWGHRLTSSEMASAGVT